MEKSNKGDNLNEKSGRHIFIVSLCVEPEQDGLLEMAVGKGRGVCVCVCACVIRKIFLHSITILPIN